MAESTRCAPRECDVTGNPLRGAIGTHSGREAWHRYGMASMSSRNVSSACAGLIGLWLAATGIPVRAADWREFRGPTGKALTRQGAAADVDSEGQRHLARGCRGEGVGVTRPVVGSAVPGNRGAEG